MNRRTNLDFVLVVEDRQDDILLLEHAWSKAGMKLPLRFVHDGQAAIDLLHGTSNGAVTVESLRAVVLDLKLPGVDGFDVLKWVRQDGSWKDVFVVVFSSSFNPADIHRAYALGANSYLVKSETFEELISLLQRFEPAVAEPAELKADVSKAAPVRDAA